MLGQKRPAMTLNNTLYRCQSYSAARKLRELMQTLEGSKQLSRVCHVEPRPVIPDEVHGSARFNCGAELKRRRLAFASKLPGIAQQIDHNHPQQPRIPIGLNAGCDFGID